MAIRIRSGLRSSPGAPLGRSQTGEMSAFTPRLLCGRSFRVRARRRWLRPWRDRWRSREPDGARRARPYIQRVPRAFMAGSSIIPSIGAMATGVQRSNIRPDTVPRNSGGAMPMTVSSCWLTRKVDPMICGLARKRRRHRPSLMMTTGVSSAVKVRPCEALIPSTSK